LREDDILFRQEIAKRAKENFKFFFNTIFIESIEAVDGEKFQGGKWVDNFCDRLQNQKKTVTTAPRKHAKTTIILGLLAWLIFRCDVYANQYSEYLYIMYSDDLACEKMTLFKQYIKVNSYFVGIVDLKTTAETVVLFNNNGHYISIKPAGIMSFKRGKHPHGVICDDILKDAEKRLDLSQIHKITQIFEAQVTPLMKEGGFIHLVGTRQDASDLFGSLSVLPGWDCSFNKAIIDRKTQEVLWPEKFTYKRLLDIELNETGKKNFLREYQDEPVRGVEGFFTHSEIEGQIDRQLVNHNPQKQKLEEFSDCYGGMDLGKKRHPSHIAVYQAVPDEKVIYLIQVASIWLDGVDYTEQLRIADVVIQFFGVASFYWDNTRAEFEGFSERGELPPEMRPFTFTAGGKEKIASEFDKQVGKKTIILLNDERQTRSILSVDGNLQSPETADGHGDAFWSNSLAIQAFVDNNSGSGFV
jgi:hypothetical protein